MILNRWTSLLGVFVVTLHVAPGVAQDLKLEISVPKTKITAHEPVNLTVKLINTSPRSYYVSGLMRLGRGQEFGTYALEVRKDPASAFTEGPYTAEVLLPRRTVSVPDFLSRHRLVLLEESMFIGRTTNSNWDGLTQLNPGRYSIRVTYSSYGDERDVPQDLRYPIFRERITSNVIEVEIQP